MYILSNFAYFSLHSLSNVSPLSSLRNEIYIIDLPVLLSISSSFALIFSSLCSP